MQTLIRSLNKPRVAMVSLPRLILVVRSSGIADSRDRVQDLQGKAIEVRRNQARLPTM